MHWEHNHYVVLVRLTRNRAQIADPATGLRWIGLEELKRKWTGRLLTLRRGISFERGNFVGLRGVPGLLSHLAHFRGSARVLFELTLATLALSLLSLGAPLLSQILFDRVLTFREEDLLPYLLVGIFALAFFQTLFTSLRAHVATNLSLRLLYRLNLGYFDHLLRLPVARLESRLPGDLLSRLGDLAQIEATLRNLVVNLPPALLTLLLSFAVLFVYNPNLALVALLVIPIHLLYLALLVPHLRENNRQQLAKGAQVNSFVLGSLEGFATLKALRGEGWSLSRGRDQFSGLNNLVWNGFLLSNWGGAAIAFLGSLFSLFLLWYGAGLVLRLELTVGQLVAAYGLVQGAVAALGSLSGMVMALQEGSVASDRLLEVVELKPEPQPLAQTLPSLQNAVQIENLSFAYQPERPLLTGVNLSLPRGSYTVLLGPNGAGKSTLAALLCQMLTPSGGTIRWDGLDLADLPPAIVRERVVYLRQEAPLLYATLRENLTLGRHQPDQTLWQTLAAVGLMEMARKLPEGLETTLGGESIFRLSSGEKQMLGLARALLSGAELVILDEPTATLDPQKEAQMVGLLGQLKGPLTLLVITHRPALLAPADQVFYLENGLVRSYQPQEVSA